MGVTRVGNLALYNNTMKDVTDVQKKLAELQQQISSGVKAQNFEGLNGQVEQYTLLESKMRATKSQMDGNSLNISRMQTADQAVSQAQGIADKMATLITQSRSAVGTSVDMPSVMKGYLNDLGQALNINFEGRYLLGGTNTASPPVVNLTGTLNSSGTPNANYYQGSQTNITYTKDERSTYDFPIRADDPAFQKIIAAAGLAMQAFGDGTSMDDASMGRALDMLQSGQNDLTTARATLGSTVLSVQDTTDQLTSLNLYWKGVTEQVGQTDLLAASTEVSNHEAVLQAAFSVFSRLSQLKLSDYLR